MKKTKKTKKPASSRPQAGVTPAESLRKVAWKRFLRAPDSELVEELYSPALSRAISYDRCCAYFSSHILAVAARGFGGLIENLLRLGKEAPRPAARLLVNEQLEPRDLKALLATGDQSALVRKLLNQFKTPADALEKNRLQMLAWLVSSGLMEVRVGLMRHTQGIAHAKFGLVTDGNGDTLGFMGSDNETGSAVLDNYEELELRTSWDDPEFVGYYRKRFSDLWDDRDPHVTTIPLPDAVKKKLIQIAPLTVPVELRPDREALEAAMLWHFLAAAPYLPNGQYACDATAMVSMWPHQVRVVEDTAEAFPAGRLLCDEVGMGKTLEAILVLRRLLCGRGVQRALIMVPAGLLQQWQDELREKGGLLVPIWEGGILSQPDGTRVKADATEALARQPLLLISREWARRENNRACLLVSPQWDLVLLDEAHAARRSSSEEGGFNSANLLLQTLRDLQLRQKARGIVLLSATPMQTQPWEPWDLLGVLGVGGAWMRDFGGVRDFYNGLAELRGNGLDSRAARKMSRLVSADKEFPSGPVTASGRDPDELETSLSFAVGHERQAIADWLQKGAPLGRRMHRNTRDTLREYHRQGLLAQEPPKREVDDVVFDYQDQAEREVYDTVASYINDRFDALERQRSGKGFVMTVYRRRAASCPAALRKSLERRAEALDRIIRRQHPDSWLTEDEIGDLTAVYEDDFDEPIDPGLPVTADEATAEKQQVVGLLDMLIALGATDSKLAKFIGVLEQTCGDGRAVLVFTEYADTMHYLRDSLLPRYGSSLGCYSGAGGQIWDDERWQITPKAEITKRLGNGSLRVLVCTDAASEGLNLQTASALINFDLPWTPSKVEQRIGRIDRIGQKQPVLPVKNLFLKDSVDMVVYGALRRRCGLFVRFVGAMQPVLAEAQRALKSNPKPEDSDYILQRLNAVVHTIAADRAAEGAYFAATAEASFGGSPTANFEDYVDGLKRLSCSSLPVRATAVKGAAEWRLSGLGRASVLVSTDRECLERNKQLLPLSACSPIVEQIAARLPYRASRAPLVIAEFADGPYRCVKACWIADGKALVVDSACHLRELMTAWNGKPVEPTRLVEVHTEARATAETRVRAMICCAEAIHRESLRQQHEAARMRLKRELARTLRCFGVGDLNRLLHTQIEREADRHGRYRRALDRLGNPNWNRDDLEDADEYIRSASARDRQSRINFGAEVDAALSDPRWIAH